MRTALKLWVPGHPVPQGSATPYSKAKLKGGRPLLAVKPANEKRLKPWRAQLTRCSRAAWDGRLPLWQDLTVHAEFRFRRPLDHFQQGKRDRGLSEKGLSYPKPTIIRSPLLGDVDKLVRAALDGVDQGDVYTDDGLVDELHVRKRWTEGEQGVMLWIQYDPDQRERVA